MLRRLVVVAAAASGVVRVTVTTPTGAALDVLDDDDEPCATLRDRVAAYVNLHQMDMPDPLPAGCDGLHPLECAMRRILRDVAADREASGWPVPVTQANVSRARLHRRRARDGEVLDFLREKRAAGPFTVLDVGGSMGSWSAEVTDYFLDQTDGGQAAGKRVFKVATANDVEEWGDVLAHVASNGKFDFVICTNFLEDVALPATVVKMLGRVGKRGFVSTPSRYWELSRACGLPYRGMPHHRWVLSVVGGAWTAFPKLNFLDYSEIDRGVFDDAHPDVCTRHTAAVLSFYWEGSLALTVANGDFLGPTVDDLNAIYAPLYDDLADDTHLALRGCSAPFSPPYAPLSERAA